MDCWVDGTACGRFGALRNKRKRRVLRPRGAASGSWGRGPSRRKAGSPPRLGKNIRAAEPPLMIFHAEEASPVELQRG